MRHEVASILVLGVALGIQPGSVQGAILGRAARQVAKWSVHSGERKAATALARTGGVAAFPSQHAASVLVRHGAAAELRIAQIGLPAAKAMAVLSPRQARQLAILAETGELARIGRTRAVLEVVERFGDRALDFVWRHKAALAVAAVLTAFLADPQPFLDGTRDLASVAATAVVQPLAQVPGRLAVAVAYGRHGTTIALATVTGLGVLALSRHHRRRVRRSRPPPHFSEGTRS
jgi:hypothetical protein